MSVCPFSCQHFYLFQCVLDDICFTRHEDELIVDYLQWIISLLLLNTEYFINPITGNHRMINFIIITEYRIFYLSHHRKSQKLSVLCLASLRLLLHQQHGNSCHLPHWPLLPWRNNLRPGVSMPSRNLQQHHWSVGQCLFVWPCSLWLLECFFCKGELMYVLSVSEFVQISTV